MSVTKSEREIQRERMNERYIKKRNINNEKDKLKEIESMREIKRNR